MPKGGKMTMKQFEGSALDKKVDKAALAKANKGKGSKSPKKGKPGY